MRLVDPPRGFAALVDVPWRLRQTKTDEYDVAVLFTRDGAGLDASVAALERDLATTGGVWVAWSKKTSKLFAALEFAEVQRAGLDAGLVDNKICRIDDDWQAMRFVRRVRDRR